jgi:hypothetical protein
MHFFVFDYIKPSSLINKYLCKPLKSTLQTISGVRQFIDSQFIDTQFIDTQFIDTQFIDTQFIGSRFIDIQFIDTNSLSTRTAYEHDQYIKKIIQSCRNYVFICFSLQSLSL